MRAWGWRVPGCEVLFLATYIAKIHRRYNFLTIHIYKDYFQEFCVYSGLSFTILKVLVCFTCESPEHIKALLSVWSLSSVFDVPDPINTDLINFTATFIPMNFVDVIYYILYQKEIKIKLNIFDYFRENHFWSETGGIPSLSPWQRSQIPLFYYWMLRMVSCWAGNMKSLMRTNKPSLST